MSSSEDESGVFVDPDWIVAHLGDPAVRVVEVDVSRAAYDAGHIPGALLWNAYSDLRHPDYTPMDTSEIGSLLSRDAIGPETMVVFYGYASYLGFWLMKRQGHDALRVMDGSRDRWELAGHPWATEAPAFEPGSHSAASGESGIDASIDAPLRTVLAQIGKPQRAVVMLDVRSQAEFDGDHFWPSGATEDVGRAGHIPGAVHVPFELLRGDDGAFRPADELRTLFEQHGITPDRRVVSYCTIGNRAAQAWFVLTNLLEYPDAGIYYGSWAEWGMLAEAPVES
jgi:thiosulfate/3-mercaptopyruvate sulfurtransferase